MIITAQDFINKTREYLGVKYKHRGRTADEGLDCIGLFSRVAQDLGIRVNDRTNYSMLPNPKKMEVSLLEHLDPIPPCEIVPGSIIWIRFIKDPQHVALVTERGTIIHSYNRVGEVVEHNLSKPWMRRINKAYKIKGVTYE